MTAMPPRFDITSDEIALLMTRFYQKVRADAVLGPVFAAHVGAEDAPWPKHEAKIGAFWRNAILFDRSYSGNPMQKHLAAHGVIAEHFEIWLAHFDATLAEVFPEGRTAASFSALAHRIGRGLRLGVADRDRPKGAVPSLFG
ncbi:group III truncated hemoglobin [Candidatus Halocynthiibacter alkanivorans]|uniref:group III truncated hemoglobin n=1 Tax=Candidatus Halocynthiibacter alkanivorans TaxID=2267619 RepID=UPI000DF29A2E|nr:group III truncated hemoglobin [Candidatus Halocynthiibacter alkanivorans]